MPRRKKVEVWMEEAVLGQLFKGKAHSMPARVIADNTDLRSDRTDILVRSIISMLIKDGHAIGSWTNGYYLIETKEELEETLEGIRVRIRGMQRRMKEIRANFERKR